MALTHAARGEIIDVRAGNDDAVGAASHAMDLSAIGKSRRESRVDCRQRKAKDG